MNAAFQAQFSIDDLIHLFDKLFKDTENTVLVKGEDEPLYLPKSASSPHHQIIFAHGFFASALHELAHWCIAGIERRQKIDYGYWYEPDGRTLKQQESFAAVEARPQALEWVFNKACGRRFHISLDNLDGLPGDDLPFKKAVLAQIAHLQQGGLPPRAEKLQRRLAHFYGQSDDWLDYRFCLSELSA